MSRVNGQVRMGAPIKVRAERLYDEDEGRRPCPLTNCTLRDEPPKYWKMGRIYNLGDIQGLQISQPQAVGLIGGGGLLLGGIFVKGPAGTIMVILGAVGIGAVGLNLIYTFLQTLPAMSPAPGMQPAPGAPLQPGQPLPAGYAAAIGPVQYATAPPPPPPPPPPKPTRTQTYTAIATAAAPIAAELIKGLVSLF